MVPRRKKKKKRKLLGTRIPILFLFFFFPPPRSCCLLVVVYSFLFFPKWRSPIIPCRGNSDPHTHTKRKKKEKNFQKHLGKKVGGRKHQIGGGSRRQCGIVNNMRHLGSLASCTAIKGGMGGVRPRWKRRRKRGRRRISTR